MTKHIIISIAAEKGKNEKNQTSLCDKKKKKTKTPN